MSKKSMQSMGGVARARALSPEERSQIASEAAATRWGIPKATHEGQMTIGKIKIPCAVLEDGTRVLTRIGIIKAIGRTGKAKGGRKYDLEFRMPVFLTAKNLKPFIPSELEENSMPLRFRQTRGGIAIGYKADLLPAICNVFLDAKDAGLLNANQMHIAEQCKILNRGFALVGITSLVDEATGYQEIRDRIALQKILEKFISSELLKWAKRFPDDFYKEMFRLKEWSWEGMQLQKPRVVGHYTNDVVYDRLAPGVLEELRRINPPDDRGQRKHKHHQWLTPDIGHPKLRDHINGVLALMRASKTWGDFKRLLNKAFPKRGANWELDL